MFSVVIPLYNKESFITDTVHSVLHQTFTDFEIIIVNDGSTDDSLQKVNTISDNRIKIVNQENKGLSAARNAGIKAAKHDYIAFLDADDLWCEDFLSIINKLIAFDKSSKIFTTKSAVLKVGKAPKLLATTFDSDKIILISNYFKSKKNIFSNSSLVIEKTVFETIGYYDETANYGEEEDFFIRCFSIFKIVHYNDYKVYYLIGIENQLTSPNNKRKRVIPEYSKHLTKDNYKTLKPYIDFVYFKLLVLYKMERNTKLVKYYKDKIKVSNLNFIQKIKYYIPSSLFYYSKNIYLKLLKVFSHS